MVLGIGEGKIEILLDKTTFKPGETVKGKVKLSLNQEKQAKELRILFYGEKSVRSRTDPKRRTTQRFFEQKIALDNEKTYAAGEQEYEFEIVLPDIPRVKSDSDSIIGKMTNMFGQIFDPIRSYKWYLDASLDISMAFDISKKMRIDLVR